MAEPRAVSDFCVGRPSEGLPDRPGCAHGEAGCSPSGPGEIPCLYLWLPQFAHLENGNGHNSSASGVLRRAYTVRA